MKNSLVFSFLILVLSFHVEASEFKVYSNIEDESLVIAIDSSRSKVLFGDQEYSAEPCNLGNSNFCIKSEMMKFTVPLSGGRNLNEQSDFEVFKSEHKDIFGKKHQLMKIRFTSDYGTIYTYWYSKYYGLIFFKLETDGKIAYFFSKTECGYAAGSECH